MEIKFKNGDRVHINGIYQDTRVGEIVKYDPDTNAYDVKGDDGYFYSCVLEEDMISEQEGQQRIEKIEKDINDSNLIELLKQQVKQLEQENKTLRENMKRINHLTHI